MPRWLRMLIVAFALAMSTGLPAALAADACGDACGDDGDVACPPFCNDCLCRPIAGPTAPLVAVADPIDEPQRIAVPLVAFALPTPPPRGVFHPPRQSA